MKIGILTFTEGYNYGNKLQNYALLTYLENNFLCEVKTVNNCVSQGTKLSKVKLLLKWAVPSKKHYMYWRRLIRFKEFNKEYLNFTVEKLTNSTNEFTEVDIFVCGSDQIWNPNYYGSIDLLTGKLPIPKRSISYAASFGVSDIPQEKKNEFAEALKNLDAISVRETQGKNICEDLGISGSTVNIDPTFLLSKSEWLKVVKKPNKKVPKKYVVTYFLGKIKEEYNKLINDYCLQNNVDRIDLNSVDALEWFDITPFEFLYLINNSEFVFTDSFHASVFSIIFGKHFLTADRISNDKNKMNSRIDTLFSTFDIKNHKMEIFNGNFNLLQLDKKNVDIVIQYEKERTKDYFLKNLFVK